MKKGRLVGVVFTIASVLAFAPATRAGPPSGEQKTAAQIAFDKAKEQFDAKNYRQACALLEESLRLDEAMGTQYQLARCYEKLDRFASAWTLYIEVADAAKAAKLAEKEKWARERADSLKPRLSTLTIVVSDAVAAQPGLQIKRDNFPVSRPLWGTPVPVDKGKYFIAATAPSRKPWSKHVEVTTEGADKKVTIPMLAEQAALPPVVPPPVTTPSATATSSAPPPIEPAPDRAQGLSGQTIAGFVVGGVGVAALGVGIGVGLAAKGNYDEAAQNCAGPVCASADVEAADDARAMGTAATVVFCIGAAAVAGGLVLWLTAPSGQSEQEPEASEISFGVAPLYGGAQLRMKMPW